MFEPEELSDPSGEFREEHLAEKAKHGLDQLDGSDIEAVIEGEKVTAEEDEEKG